MFEHRLHFKANEHDLGSCPRQTIQYNNNSSLCPYHQFRRSWSIDQLRSWSVLWRPRRPPRTHTKNRCSTHRWGLKCKSRKSRDTWSNRQVWPWRTKWSRAKANWILPRECTGHSKHFFNNTRDDLQRHHQMVNTEIRLIVFFAAKDGEALHNQEKHNWELTLAQIMNFLLPNSDEN